MQSWVQGAAGAPDNPYNRLMWKRLLCDETLVKKFWVEVEKQKRTIEAQAFRVENRKFLLDALKQKMSGLDALLVLRNDRYGNEFLSERAEILRFVSGFSGSFGWTILDFRAKKKSLVASDARYRLQLKRQCDSTLFETREASLAQVAETLKERFATTGLATTRIGYDPWQVSEHMLSNLREGLRATDIRLVPVAARRIEALWHTQPPAPLSLLSLRRKNETGENPQQRLARGKAPLMTELGTELEEESAARSREGETLLLTTSDAVAWALSLRASDIPFLPVALGFALLDFGGDKFSKNSCGRARFFSRARPSVAKEDLSHLTLLREEALGEALAEQGKHKIPLRLDRKSVPSALVSACRRRNVPLLFGEDPTQDLRLCKTPRERANIRRAHVWDGVAWVRFFAWLAERGRRRETISERCAASALSALRMESGKLLDESFETISASGANGAMIHYPTPRENTTTDASKNVSKNASKNVSKNVSKNASLLRYGAPYLIDSGGQYAEGTTDLTRTLVYGDGSGTEDFRQAYTAVLRGHIALAATRFPEGTSASALDALARHALWQKGLDYPHATGHGVGFCLGVHEGSVRFSQSSQSTCLRVGMILSNEPGFYRPRKFGIRIENLLEVVATGKKNSEGKNILEFHTLSLAPIAKAPIILQQMEGREICWLNAYHARVCATIAPFLRTSSEREFLKEATRPLANK